MALWRWQSHPRCGRAGAGFNWNVQFVGGVFLVEANVIFTMVRETSDHVRAAMGIALTTLCPLISPRCCQQGEKRFDPTVRSIVGTEKSDFTYAETRGVPASSSWRNDIVPGRGERRNSPRLESSIRSIRRVHVCEESTKI